MLSSLHKTRIKSRLYLLFSLILLSGIAIAFLSIRSVRELNHGMKSLYQDRILVLKYLQDISDNYATILLDTLSHVRNKKLTPREASIETKKQQENIAREWETYKSTYITPDERKIANQTEDVMRRISPEISRLIFLYEKGDLAQIEEFGRFSAHNLYEEIFFITRKLRQIQIEIAEGSSEVTQADNS